MLRTFPSVIVVVVLLASGLGGAALAGQDEEYQGQTEGEEAREPMLGDEPQVLEPPIQPSDAGTVSPVCGTSSGTRFNLEPRPNARSQHTQSVDFLRNQGAAGMDLIVGGSTDARRLGGSLSGYYVSRDVDCAPEFEGSLPPVTDPFEPGDLLLGQGGAVVAADPARDAIFMADYRSDSTTTGVGVFRSSAATLLTPTACPMGTHTQGQAATCWPTKRIILAGDSLDSITMPPVHLAVDERTSGTGAGDVYIAAIEGGDVVGNMIRLAACTNNLVNCSQTRLTDDIDVQNLHIAVRLDGSITLTYITCSIGCPPEHEIKYVHCTPVGASNGPPSCQPPVLVHQDQQALSGTRMAAQAFRLTTRPQHGHRVDANGTETYVVWDRCKVVLLPNNVCPDVDVVMKASSDNGATWSALTCIACGAQDQMMPFVKTDRSRNIVNIALYSSSADPTFQHRGRVLIYHINPGGATPDPVEPHVITTLLNDPSGDPFGAGFGSSIGVAARGTRGNGQSRAYVHYTYNNIQGTYNGVQAPEPNNHLSRLDY